LYDVNPNVIDPTRRPAPVTGNPPEDTKPTATRLTPERVVDGAMALADEIGINALTIRKLAEAIDAKPMTIYHHLPNKEAIIDAMVERVFSEIERPPTDTDWRSAILVRCRSMRRALATHPWAAALMESRSSPGVETLGHHDAVLGCFRNAGFSLELAGHAYALIDAFVYGFALQETTLPATGGEEMAGLAEQIVGQLPPSQFPHLAEFTAERVLQPGYDFGNEFEFGLQLILDGLDAEAHASSDTT
jgi:AcrR family transcriptional regulator